MNKLASNFAGEVMSCILVCQLAIFAGCVPGRWITYPQEYTVLLNDAKRLHPLSNLEVHTIALTEEAALGLSLSGIGDYHSGDRIRYVEAMRVKGHIGTTGAVFSISGDTRMRLIVSVHERNIQAMAVVFAADTPATPKIHDEFLNQFIGRTLSDSWEFVESPKDSIRMPTKLKKLSTAPDLSETIARLAKTALILNEIVESQYDR